jgi:hypothetical protein
MGNFLQAQNIALFKSPKLKEIVALLASSNQVLMMLAHWVISNLCFHGNPFVVVCFLSLSKQ